MSRSAGVAVSRFVRQPGADTAPATAGARPKQRRSLLERLPAGRPERLALLGLAAILLLGALVRVLLMLAWSPAFMGFPGRLVKRAMRLRAAYGVGAVR
jgi:hypothetical protein